VSVSGCAITLDIANDAPLIISNLQASPMARVIDIAQLLPVLISDVTSSRSVVVIAVVIKLARCDCRRREGREYGDGHWYCELVFHASSPSSDLYRLALLDLNTFDQSM